MDCPDLESARDQSLPENRRLTRGMELLSVEPGGFPKTFGDVMINPFYPS